MTTRDYLVRLAIVFGIFFVLVPGALYALALTPYAQANPVIGMPIYFFGVPLWMIALSLALWRATASRLTAVHLPYALSLCFISSVLGDRMAFMTFFQQGLPFFFGGAIAVAVALVFWPERRGPDDDRTFASRMVAIASFAVHAGLALLPIAGLALYLTTGWTRGIGWEFLGPRFAVWTFVLVLLSQIWAIFEARRSGEYQSPHKIG